MHDLPARPKYTYSEEDWIQIRAHFMSSILADLHLHKLAQNIGASWPLRDPGETAAKYLEFSFDELAAAPGLDGHPARLQLLLDILKETAAFDDPFQEMMEGKADPVREKLDTDQILERLKISPDFPIEFTALSKEIKNLCHSEGATSLGQSVALLQQMAQNVHLSGEVRQLLNSLTHTDENGIAKFLPFRPASQGLHFPETFRNLFKALPDSEQENLISSRENDPARKAVERRLRLQLPRLFEWFPAEAGELKESVLTEQPLDRFFHPLNDPPLEAIAIRIIQHYFTPEKQVAAQNQTSFIGRFLARFRRN